MNFIFVSTTSKHNKEYLELPNKMVFEGASLNFLVSNLEVLEEIIEKHDKNETLFLLDTEKKQGLSLYDEADISNKIDYKPNDLTMEAADLAVINYFGDNIQSKAVAIYGTGNIAFKVALRLSERNIKVFLYGRNKDKIRVCIDALKQVSFDSSLIEYGNNKTKVDGLLSFVSAEEIIGEEFLAILNQTSICLDGGIGNFSKQFIKTALKVGHEVRRLDVRQSQEIMEGYIKSRFSSRFNNIIGRDRIKGISVVAGGIMGLDGELIVDRITKPSKVVGVANGIGGVKNDADLSNEEREKIKAVQSYIEQGI
ncbi:hypothetical protein FO441_01155 [Salinicoccus cyprini]|uniref:Quinate/shikimate 5-dehydrogenase/glutamyl-tRNA reductase domain-containing protein n=1 Tax=Salinicoccus cyprini TaxID=2493691 RepID=A0A558AXD2_9STAP|nr:hypothetical protein [Salinicoccus cyprini]TVT28917.1 hypothetical protein FO441_01155 [Salinicoccus cyprini]